MPTAAELVTALEARAAEGPRWRDTDTGIGIILSPLAGERFWILPLDLTEAARRAALSAMGRDSGPICDLLVVLSGEGRPSICAVELKGRNITRGLSQLLAVVGDLLPPQGREAADAAVVRACLLSTSPEPGGPHYRRRRARLEGLLGEDSVLVKTGLPSRTELDVTRFVRSGR